MESTEYICTSFSHILQNVFPELKNDDKESAEFSVKKCTPHERAKIFAKILSVCGGATPLKMLNTEGEKYRPGTRGHSAFSHVFAKVIVKEILASMRAANEAPTGIETEALFESTRLLQFCELGHHLLDNSEKIRENRQKMKKVASSKGFLKSTKASELEEQPTASGEPRRRLACTPSGSQAPAPSSSSSSSGKATTRRVSAKGARSGIPCELEKDGEKTKEGEEDTATTPRIVRKKSSVQRQESTTDPSSAYHPSSPVVDLSKSMYDSPPSPPPASPPHHSDGSSAPHKHPASRRGSRSGSATAPTHSPKAVVTPLIVRRRNSSSQSREPRPLSRSSPHAHSSGPGPGENSAEFWENRCHQLEQQLQLYLSADEPKVITVEATRAGDWVRRHLRHLHAQNTQLAKTARVAREALAQQAEARLEVDACLDYITAEFQSKKADIPQCVQTVQRARRALAQNPAGESAPPYTHTLPPPAAVLAETAEALVASARTQSLLATFDNADVFVDTVNSELQHLYHTLTPLVSHLENWTTALTLRADPPSRSPQTAGEVAGDPFLPLRITLARPKAAAQSTREEGLRQGLEQAVALLQQQEEALREKQSFSAESSAVGSALISTVRTHAEALHTLTNQALLDSSGEALGSLVQSARTHLLPIIEQLDDFEMNRQSRTPHQSRQEGISRLRTTAASGPA